jgi:hypothetical protein
LSFIADSHCKSSLFSAVIFTADFFLGAHQLDFTEQTLIGKKIVVPPQKNVRDFVDYCCYCTLAA